MNNNFTILSTKILKPYIAQQFVDNDFNIIEHNFITIEPQNVEGLDIILQQQNNNYIFTSKNAVKCFADYIEKNNVKVDKKTTIFSLSGETQNTLIDAGFKPTLVAENAENLATEIISKANIKNVVFFCGNKRRPNLLNIFLGLKIV